MKERTLSFGPAMSRVGVLTVPGPARSGAPAVLLLNAGLIHRVGPYRLYVTLARRLASLGFPVLRFDFAGVGDSGGADDGLTVPERALADVRAAMDAVTAETDAQTFVAMGLCSGAFASHMAAVADDRVVGTVQVDGYVYPTRGFHVRHYARRALVPAAWLRRLHRWTGARDPSPGPEHAAPFAAEMIPRARFESELAALVERGVALMFVLTRGGLQPVNYAGQLQDCVPSVDLETHATVVHDPLAHHTFPDGERRRALVDSVAQWIDRSFPALSSGDSRRTPRSSRSSRSARS